jgi:hypothetical protein
MGAPTPDETPDIRLSTTTLADLQAAAAPNGHQKIAVEPTADADLGFKMLVFTDDDGAGGKLLAKDEPARVTDFEATGTPTLSSVSAGVAVVDGAGLVSSVPGLTGLNFTLGTSIDESSDPRDPNVHHLTHENGGADEISVAGLSGELADAQPTTRQKAYNGGFAVSLDATHNYITRTNEDGGKWIITDEAGTRQILQIGETSGDGVVATLDVDALVSSSTGGCDHTIQGDGSEDDSAVRVHTEMSDSGVDPDHSVQLAEWTVNHDDATETESGVWIFAEYDAEDM